LTIDLYIEPVSIKKQGMFLIKYMQPAGEILVSTNQLVTIRMATIHAFLGRDKVIEA
jgi:hypothetical protein